MLSNKHKENHRRPKPEILIDIKAAPNDAVVDDAWYCESLRLKSLHEAAPGLQAALQRLLALHKRMMLHINHGAAFDDGTLKEIHEAPNQAIGALRQAGVK